MSEVPLSDVWVTANLKETQTANVTPGDPADFTVDAYPGRHVKGHVESLSPATGAKFSLLPPDNATGNFTKVVQRIPVRIRPDAQNDATQDRKSTRLNSSHGYISYAVFCLKKKKQIKRH